MLAAVAGLADCWSLGLASSGFTDPPALGGSTAMEPGLYGQRVHCGKKGGGERPVRTPQIAADSARSATSSLIDRVFR